MFIYIFVLHNGILKDLYNSFIDMQIDLIQYCNAFSLFQSFKSTTLIDEFLKKIRTCIIIS